MTIKLIFLTLLLLAIAVMAIAVKIILKKDGRIEGTCASLNPELNPDNKPCSFCGRTREEYTGNCDRELYHRIAEEKEKGDLTKFFETLNQEK
jgi:hypothetical protein